MAFKPGKEFAVEAALYKAKSQAPIRVVEFQREIIENQPQYGGTMINQHTVFDDDAKCAYVYVATDSEDFGSIENMETKGLLPGEGGSKGASMFCKGKTLEAYQMPDSEPEEVIASYLSDPENPGKRKWVFRRSRIAEYAKIEEEGGEEGGYDGGALTIDASDKLIEQFRTHYDLEFAASHGFKNIFRAKTVYRTLEERKRLLAETGDEERSMDETAGKFYKTVSNEVFTTFHDQQDLMLDTATTSKVKVIYNTQIHVFSEKLKGMSPEERESCLGKKRQTVGEPYRPLQSEANTQRTVLSFDIWANRYIKPENIFHINDVEFVVDIGDQRYVVVTDSTTYVAEGKRGGGQRLEVVNDGVEGYKAGAEPRGGYRPRHVGYCYIQALNDVNESIKKDRTKRNCYARLEDNAVSKLSDNQYKNVMAWMGVQYATGHQGISITTLRIKKIEEENRDKERTPINRRKFEINTELRPDFRVTFRASNPIWESYAKAARNKVPAAMRAIHKELFPIPETDATPFFKEESIVRAGAKKKSKSVSEPSTYGFELETQKGARKYKAGKSKIVAYYNAKSSAFMSLEGRIVSPDAALVTATRISQEELEKVLKSRGHNKPERTKMLEYSEEVAIRCGKTEPEWYLVTCARLAKKSSEGVWENFYKDEDGKNRPYTKAEFQADFDDPILKSLWNYQTGQVKIRVEGETEPVMIARIVDVPERKSSRRKPKKPVRGPDVSKGPSDDEACTGPETKGKDGLCKKERHTNNVWCNRPPEIICHVVISLEGGMEFKMNKKNSYWSLMADYKDHKGSEAQKVSNRIWNQCGRFVCNLLSVAQQITLESGDKMASCAMNETWLEDFIKPALRSADGDPENGYINQVQDLLINHALHNAFLSGFCAEDFAELRDIREKSAL